MIADVKRKDATVGTPAASADEPVFEGELALVELGQETVESMYARTYLISKYASW